jgi:hypothetical protein
VALLVVVQAASLVWATGLVLGQQQGLSHLVCQLQEQQLTVAAAAAEQQQEVVMGVGLQGLAHRLPQQLLQLSNLVRHKAGKHGMITVLGHST